MSASATLGGHIKNDVAATEPQQLLSQNANIEEATAQSHCQIVQV